MPPATPTPSPDDARPPRRRARSEGRGPSMADVAAHVGVSHQTVSRVLNDSPLVRPDTREKVLAAIAELGYRRNTAARVLATNRSGRIGFVGAGLALHGPAMIGAALSEAAHRAGYDVSSVTLDDVSAAALTRAVERLLDQAVEAVVVAAAHSELLAAAQGLRLDVPLVVVQGVTPGQPLAAGIDQDAGARLATGHLLDLGHARVAHVAGPEDWVEARQRRAGWLAAHAERGLTPGPEVAGDWSPAAGHAAAAVLLEADEPVTAVFCANDDTALGLLGALHAAGVDVPGEVSVVGFDDAPGAGYLWPPLTTVAQRFSELGRLAVDLAVRALDGEPDPTAPLLVPALVVRASTAPPRG
ncbi:LacI family DNA-binding transcriptional regulator [Nocardioides sp. GY 10127]|uniref:LacI family DNA-binding transcriptional regulator n=1 Tax=Nocardioides sp. GY 10127 TaxID=2569762 RepID=UPI0010A7544F|nr:LacI family DNA-binding transcriptional regulator [Nocardioides sp. GY 10127]TIC82648.1 LacI family transcriptional regulator [Nocardioides sp. GY 10127]